MSTLVDCGAGVRLERGVACSMSDGVVLYADHYYPPQPGPQPTLLMRQPYGRDIASTVVYAHPAWFARHGYNVVIQDVRGRGDSGGEFYPFRNEARDGAETIAFLIQRRESNGRLGMYGFSYQGMTQLLAAAEQPPGLECIAPAMTAHDLYHGWFYHGGALRLASTLGWGLQMLRADARRLGLRETSCALESAWTNLAVQYLTTPYARHVAICDNNLPTYLRDWIEHELPGGFWAAMDVSKSVEQIQVPALHLCGWYDTYLTGSVEGFLALRSRASPSVRENQYLVAGPWIHIPWADRIGQRKLGPSARLDTDALLLRWCNHWLKDSSEFSNEPRIRHYALQQDTWFEAQEFPETAYTLYLHSAGRANSRMGDGVLTIAASREAEPPDIFVYDPEVPVVAPGGLVAASGPLDQVLLGSGNNVLVYTSPPLEAAMHIFGSAKIALHASSSAASTDFVAKLICVKPSGEAIFIAIGIARSKYLFNMSYEPDKPLLWSFSLEPTSCVFDAGDCIRVEIASSAYPLYDRNPGTTTEPRYGDADGWQRSTQLVYHDSSHASSLHLPVIAAHSASDACGANLS